MALALVSEPMSGDWLPLREHLRESIEPFLRELLHDPNADPRMRACLAYHFDAVLQRRLDVVELGLLRRRLAEPEQQEHRPRVIAVNGHAAQ